MALPCSRIRKEMVSQPASDGAAFSERGACIGAIRRRAGKAQLSETESRVAEVIKRGKVERKETTGNRGLTDGKKAGLTACETGR